MLVTPAFAQAESGTHAEPADEAHGEMHSETGVAGEGHHGEGAFPPFNPDTFASQLLWLAITFGLFYYFMKRTVVPRIGGILENRRDRIAQDLDEASRLRDETDEAIAAYEQELASARSKAHELAETAREKAKAAAEAERAELEAGLNEKMAKAEKQIADIKAKALGEVDTIAGETTTAIIEQLIGAKSTDAEIAEAIKSAGGK